MSKPRFRFNKQLWQRFIESAQPYFFPVERRQTRIFLGLIVVLLVTVVSFTFFLTVGLTLLGKTIFPEFFGQAARGLIKNVDSLLVSPAPYVFFVLLVLCGLIFASQYQKLKQRWPQW